MKRIAILLLVTCVTVLALASAAYAGTTSGYATWDPAAPNDNPATPHKGYALNTNKCAVCHAVHKGTDGGEVLLRSTVGDACDYCHILTNIGGDRLYNGTTDAKTDVAVGEFGGGFNHGNDCTNCHSVHGASTMAGAKSSRILYDWNVIATRDYSTYALEAWPDPSTVADGDEQVTAWCTGCHPYFTPYYADGSATGVYDGRDQIGTDGWFQSHVMTVTPVAGYGNTAATNTGIDAAFAGSTVCVSCHDAPNDGTNIGNVPANGVYANHFPHYTRDYYRFMQVATSTVGAANMNTTGTIDGLCLKCHRDATDGAGITY